MNDAQIKEIIYHMIVGAWMKGIDKMKLYCEFNDLLSEAEQACKRRYQDPNSRALDRHTVQAVINRRFDSIGELRKYAGRMGKTYKPFDPPHKPVAKQEWRL